MTDAGLACCSLLGPGRTLGLEECIPAAEVVASRFDACDSELSLSTADLITEAISSPDDRLLVSFIGVGDMIAVKAGALFNRS